MRAIRSAVSARFIPAAGSSSSSTSGPPASARAISSRRCAPYGSSPGSASARSARPTSRSSSSESRSIADSSRWNDRVRTMEASSPLRVRWCCAAFTLSSTVIPPNSRMFWNVRVTPRRAISCGGRPTRLSPRKTMSPESGRYTPLIRLNSVVFPAPFGPMRPTRSPGVKFQAGRLDRRQAAERARDFVQLKDGHGRLQVSANGDGNHGNYGSHGPLRSIVFRPSSIVLPRGTSQRNSLPPYSPFGRQRMTAMRIAP